MNRPMLTAEQAAEWLGCVSVAQFYQEVKQGVWPPPLAARSRPQRWSRAQIEARLQPPQVNGSVAPGLNSIDTIMGLS